MPGSPAICRSRICLCTPGWGSCATAARGVLDTSGVQRRGNVLQDSWEACASHQAARCLEEHIEMSDLKEEIHEDY